MIKKQKRILKSYNAHEDGDISTERLLALVCDDCDCDVDDVMGALMADCKRKQNVKMKRTGKNTIVCSVKIKAGEENG